MEGGRKTGREGNREQCIRKGGGGGTGRYERRKEGKVWRRGFFVV